MSKPNNIIELPIYPTSGGGEYHDSDANKAVKHDSEDMRRLGKKQELNVRLSLESQSPRHLV